MTQDNIIVYDVSKHIPVCLRRMRRTYLVLLLKYFTQQNLCKVFPVGTLILILNMIDDNPLLVRH